MPASDRSRTADIALRAICRAVVRRVCEEHPQSVGYELFLRLWAAYPFGTAEADIEQVWLEEVLEAVGDVDALIGLRTYAGRPSHGERQWTQ